MRAGSPARSLTRKNRVTDSDRWQHAERLFHAALTRDHSERAAFLGEACRGDDALRRDVESLLTFESDAQGFMQEPAVEIASSLLQSDARRRLAGQRLGPYAIGTLLGAGGMGDVYRARDTLLGRDVAIKILPEAFTADADRRARFEREARLLAALNHPHIGAIYGFEQRHPSTSPGQAGVHALVLELVEGETLADRLREGPLPIGAAMTMARQIAEALDAAHEKGIVHHDLKPSNIMLTPDGIVKVVDFGLAKAEAEEPMSGASDDTRDGVILGTAAYMSPEQVRGKRTDKRTDIWAFGCVVWAMLTARAPFAGDTVSDTIAAILDREPAWETLPPDTPANVQRLLRRCLEKDPKRRLRDIGDAPFELEDAPARVSSSRPAARRIAAWCAAAVCILCALAVGGYAIPSAPAPRGVARFHVLPPAEAPIRDVALSADGRRLAFASVGADRQRRLWVRSTDSLEAQALEGTEGALLPFWSPDGRFIAFFAQGKLRKIAAGGGAPQVLCDASDGRGGTWNSDGTILFAPIPDGGLYLVSANGGKPEPVTMRGDGQTGHRFPQFLPDGRHFLYLAQTGRGTSGGIFVGSLDSSETVLVLETVVSAQYAAPGYLLFIRNNALMAQSFDPGTMRLSGEVVSIAEDIYNEAGGGGTDFSVAEGVLAYRERARNLGELIWVDRAGQPLGNTGSRGDFIHPWLSPDGRRAVVEIVDPENQTHGVWMLDLVRGSRSQFIPGPSQSHFPVWSADGRTILFSSDRGGPWRLFTKPTVGPGVEEELLTATTNNLAIDWSRDGRFILYQTVDNATRADVWALPVAPRGQPFAVANSPRNERQAQLSPDGRWVAYTSDASGGDDVWVQGFPDATEKWMVSTAGGSQPQWRRDGRELFYLSRDLRVMAVDVNARGPSFDAGVPKQLFSLKTADQLSARNNYMPASDGKRFLVNTSYSGLGTGVAVVLDWASAIRH
jgi:Tol biopolymer transport system component